MKRNINLMQSNSDIDSNFINQLGKEYILQALANLGQRIGIKGDGLKYGSFSFIELLNNEEETYSSEDYIGYLEYVNNNAVIGINNIKANTDKILDNLKTKNINNTLFSNREFSFTIPVNSIEKYCKNSIISNKDNILTIITVGKKIGYEDNDNNNAVLLYYKYDISTNKLIYSVKSGHVYSDTGNDYYYLIKLSRKLDEYGNYFNNKYELTLKLFNTSNLDDRYKESFINTYCYENHNLENSLILNFINPDFIDIDNLEQYNDDLSYNYDSNSPISIILNNVLNSNYHNTTVLDVDLDTSANQFLWVSESDYENIISLYQKEYKFTNIAEELYYLNNDITEFYENIFRYYNEKFYLETRLTFLKRILCMLFEKIYNDIYKEDNTINISDFRLYIPLHYNINYVCNSNNELDIYYSNDIYVLLTDLNEAYNRSDILENNDYLIFDYVGVTKVRSYKFDIEYNNKLEDVINNVSIKNIYTMPFVDTDENWNINNYNTKIRAIGKDAGNPNIIIIHSINNEEYKILSSISKNIDLNTIKFKSVKFDLHKNLFSNLLSNDDTKCIAWMPIITSANNEIFENSIIINISDLTCLDNQNNINYYLGSNVITIWNYSVNDNGYDFEVIKNDEGYVIPLGVTHNLESVLAGTTLLNLNEQDLLILKARLINEIGQNQLNNTSYNWGIIKNKNSSEYNPDTTKLNEYDENFNYKNNLNAIIEYTDNLTLSSSEAKYSYITKYISDINNILSEGVTNILYPKYKVTTDTNLYNVESVLFKIEKQLETAEYTKLDINGDIYTINNEIYDIISNKLKKTYVTNTVEVSSKYLEKVTENGNQVYYDEYVFNSNVPNIDFKEIFLRNVNTLNRYNIISLDKDGNTYYSYLGSDYNDPDKSVLHLSSISQNINVGTDTLMNLNDTNEFKTQETLSIDFNNIVLNGQKTISLTKNQIVHKVINDKHYYAGEYNILDTVSNEIFDYSYFYNIDNGVNNEFNFANTNMIGYRNDTLYTNIHNNVKGVIYKLEYNNIKSYFIYLNKVIYDLFNINIEENITNVKLECGGNQLIALINQEVSPYKVPKMFLKINDDLIIEDSNRVVWSTDTLDILLYVENTSIKIICKFDKYNLEKDYITSDDHYRTISWNYITGLGWDINTSTDEETPITQNTEGWYYYIGVNQPNIKANLKLVPLTTGSSQGWRKVELENGELPASINYGNEILISDTMDGESFYVMVPVGYKLVDAGEVEDGTVIARDFNTSFGSDAPYVIYQLYNTSFFLSIKRTY